MQVADLIRLMLEQLSGESRDYFRLRKEVEQVRAERELTRKRIALLSEALEQHT